MSHRQARAARPVSPQALVGARSSGMPVVTPVLIGLNLLAFVVTVVQANSLVDNQGSALFGDWVLWPRAIAGADQWWRLVTSGFLHFGPLHILSNMVALLVLGRDLEPLLGKARFLVLYLVSLLGGAAAVYAFGDANGATAGASGAIFGLLAGALVVVLRMRLNPMPIIVTVGLNAVITLRVPQISVWEHLGGFLTGLVVIAVLVYAPKKNRVWWQAAGVLVVVAVAVALVVHRDAQLAGVMCGPDAQAALVCTPG
ncbi:rhomboid family intramembrane serine protease [Amycolatopsis cynarae]|uniref:Rhomboid family intramembrane serine protease n=1 Tax=Amycolatopsis cynarae TaxID=2995223 RepID=A0ABY7B046_9PSEU|nr:rhomboid family intramembrane serine protease [Amycolatopsis sp. HUAS 11-8]WAL65571.1 rhomboid family intramembrane serine protease [Amycolatopsis sp. HUAS 11-8]